MQRQTRWLRLVLIGVVGVATAGCASTTHPAATNHSSTTLATAKGAVGAAVPTIHRANVESIGTYGVGRMDVTYIDRSRATPANGSYQGAPSRKLHTLTWYPSAAVRPGGDITDNARPDATHGLYPLIILSHGVTGLAAVYEGTAAALASAGYVVVAPDYPLSNAAAPGGPTIDDVQHQPADASFVLDHVLTDNATRFGGVIDSDHIGAVGHSLGAITTLGLTFAKCCTDPRIDAAVSLAGAVYKIDAAKSYFTGPAVPVLFFHGTSDGTVPYAASQSAYASAKAPKAFITIPGGTHVGPFLGVSNPLVGVYHRALVAWLDRWLKGDVNALDSMREAVKSSLGTLKLVEQLR